MNGGRLYGRGAADDKSGIAAHLAALRAFGGKPPVHVKILVEGAEENGRQKLLGVVDRDPELMRADVIVVADNGNWKVGEPTLSLTLRGHGKLTVTLTTLSTALHSGHFGGAAPDALLALTRLIATLHDADGNVAVEGLEDGDWDGAEWPEADFRRQAGVLDGVSLVGDGAISDRVWARHAISVLGLDAPPVDGAGNIVIPQARAKIAVRVPPGADPVRSMDAVERHLRAHVPWGAQLEIEARARLDGDRPHRGRRRRARARAGLRQAGGAHGQRRLGAARGQAARRLPGRRADPVGRAGLRPRPHPRRERVGRPRRGGEDRARRGVVAGGPQPVLTARAGELRGVNTALPPKRALKRSRP